MRYFRLSSFFFLAAAVVTAGDPTVRTGVRTNTTWSQLLVAGVNAQLQSRHADAVVSYESAIAAREELLAHDDPLIAVVLNNIADVDLVDGKYDHAIHYCRKALSINEAASGPNAPLIANDLNTLGVASAKRGNMMASGYGVRVFPACGRV